MAGYVPPRCTRSCQIVSFDMPCHVRSHRITSNHVQEYDVSYNTTSHDCECEASLRVASCRLVSQCVAVDCVVLYAIVCFRCDADDAHGVTIDAANGTDIDVAM